MRDLVAASIALALLATGSLSATAKSKKAKDAAPRFDVEAFNANATVADWLLAYDFAAWKASDLVMQEPEETLKQLGQHWFCFKDARSWHALFGRYEPETNVYQQQLHYVRRGDEMVRIVDLVDPAFASRNGRALHTLLTAVPEVAKLPVKLNHYVHPIAGDKLEVWLLPAMQPDGVLVFGGELRLVLDAAGATILEQDFISKEFKGAKANPEVDLVIDRTSGDVPTVGDIFVLRQFRDAFKSISVKTRCHLTRMLEKDGEEIAWIHVERDTPECNGKAPR